MPRETGRKVIAQNKRARHDFHIEDTFEAGIVLQGTEVKSLRAGRASLTDGYATIKDGEAWLINVHIPEYTLGTWTNHAARRTRKLLLHRKEIDKLLAKTKESGLTIIPLALYFKDGKAKIEIGLGRGKKDWDKRHALAEKQAKREMARATRHKHR
ncbi:SsrA-binding protein SmpB [Sinosporangium siamense]|nr:SsrA-binding protein SmpB [Sinosporangium siamense]